MTSLDLYGGAGTHHKTLHHKLCTGRINYSKVITLMREEPILLTISCYSR